MHDEQFNEKEQQTAGDFGSTREFRGAAHVAQREYMHRRMLKKATFSPAQPRRAKTRRSAGKAAKSEDRRRTLWGARCDE